MAGYFRRRVWPLFVESMVRLGSVFASYTPAPESKEDLLPKKPEPVLSDPPAGHPERVCPEQQPTPAETALFRQLGWRRSS
ncbi:DUF6059 family protein [Actinocrispum sp. NPDC049592]|uniref:DUF6059 family protein n=1 Tax=Actinocrispum sp. NPDC049592 TaxID=3154835 RepID=UPI00341ADBA8